MHLGINIVELGFNIFHQNFFLRKEEPNQRVKKSLKMREKRCVNVPLTGKCLVYKNTVFQKRSQERESTLTAPLPSCTYSLLAEDCIL